MRKKVILSMILIAGLILFSSFKVYAQENVVTNNISTMSISDNINIAVSCTGSNAALGDVNDPDSVAWLLQKLLNYIKILGPFLVLIYSSIDFIKAIVTSDDESLKKATKNLSMRLILALALFLIPVFVSVMLNIVGLTSDLCGLE
ncbi:MAG: hypothetical protein MR031_03395 [Tenericutes bacterium]|nr:hypothetical protein [Mycoplasmatota bacterium]